MKLTKIAFVFLFISFSSTSAQQAGEQYLLHRPGKMIPAHPSPGDHTVSDHYAHGAIAKIMDKDATTGWLKVQVGQAEGWIIKKYLGPKVEMEEPVSGNVFYNIGTWNIEWLKDNATRGFPEYNNGGPKLQARTGDDFAAIADIIKNDLQAVILVLEEINAVVNEEGDEALIQSVELDRLLSHLGPNYEYQITRSGGDQHIAVLYDVSKARLNSVREVYVPPFEMQKKDIFDRDPLVAHFTLLSGGIPKNDFVVVGLHLASGQDKNKNHDKAMETLLSELEKLRSEGVIIPQGENDMVITGDLNLNIFDNKKELVLENMESGPFDILANGNYPGTRLAGVPLTPKSKIDYIIVTDNMRGSNKEINKSQAEVHQELAEGDFDDYRLHLSDHFPVTIKVKLIEDDD